ncbi:MAG: tripartite tricarboxylate transporter substrate binding protein [Betaproteobacteria bacterium]|nr:tripartite tricarboxylate transporter substrate binding protein [Betaproteobacteria bacterium]
MKISTAPSILCLCLFAAVAFAQPAATGSGQAFPNKAIRIVVAYPPGGGTDVLARLLGKYLNDALRQPIVVENRAGANGQIGVDYVAKSPADGYTLLAIAAGPLNDENLSLFAPIALFAAPSYVLVVNPEVSATTVRELVALARSQPGRLAYGSTGGGAASHLAVELFKAMAGIDMLHVPYKGVGSAVADLLGNQVQLMISPAQSVVAQVKSGKLRALAVSGSERSPSLPELPTISEAGVPGYSAEGWFGMVAPAGTPKDIVARLNRDVNGVLQLAEVKTRLIDLGASPASTTPEQFLEFIRRDNAKWAKLIKERGIVVEGAK